MELKTNSRIAFFSEKSEDNDGKSRYKRRNSASVMIRYLGHARYLDILKFIKQYQTAVSELVKMDFVIDDYNFTINKNGKGGNLTVWLYCLDEDGFLYIKSMRFSLYDSINGIVSNNGLLTARMVTNPVISQNVIKLPCGYINDLNPRDVKNIEDYAYPIVEFKSCWDTIKRRINEDSDLKASVMGYVESFVSNLHNDFKFENIPNESADSLKSLVW